MFSISRAGFSTSVMTDIQGPHPLTRPPSSYPIPLEIKVSFLFSPILGSVPSFPSFCGDNSSLGGPTHTGHATPPLTLPQAERRGSARRSLGDVSIPYSLRDGWGPGTALEFVGGKRSLPSGSLQSLKTHRQTTDTASGLAAGTSGEGIMRMGWSVNTGVIRTCQVDRNGSGGGEREVRSGQREREYIPGPIWCGVEGC